MKKRANAGIGVMILVVLVAAGLGLFAKLSAQPGIASLTGAAIYNIPDFCSDPGVDDYIGCVDLNADGKVNYSDEEIFSQILDLTITDPEILVYADFDGNGLVDNLIDFQECFVPLRDFYQDKYDGNVSCNTQVGEDEFGAPDRTGCTDGCPDLNSDGYVSRDDLNLLRALKNKSISMSNYPMADLTGGGNVTQEDLDCWQVFRYTYVTCNLPVHANHTNTDVCADFRNEYGTGNDVIVNDTDKNLFDAYKEVQNLEADFNGDNKINWLDKFVFNEYYSKGMTDCDVYHAPWHTGGIDQNMSEGGADSITTIQSYYGNTQSFNVSREGFLTKVRVRLAKNTVSITTNLSVAIWNSTGSPATTPNPLHVLAETVYNDFETNISFPGEWVTIPFVKPPYVEQNKTYHIAIRTSNSGEYNWTNKSGNPYPEGEAWTNISGSWTQASNTDMYFYAYTTTACADMNADGIVDSDDEDLIDTIPDGITPTGSENWNSSYDLNNDSIIDEADSSLVSTADGDEKAFVDQQTTGSPGTSKNLGHNLSLVQPFTSSSLMELKYVNLSIARGKTSSSNLLVEIRAYDSVTGPDMASSALAAKTISSIANTKFNWTLVEFSPAAFLTAGTGYAIVVSADRTSDGSTAIYNWSECSGTVDDSGTLVYNSSAAEYIWTDGASPLCFSTYTGNTFDFNDTLDVNDDNIINSTDSALIIAANGSYGPSYWTPLVDFNAKFEVYEESLDKGLGFDAYIGQIETCGFPYYLKHECGDLRCSMEYPYSETYENCPQDCSSCNNDSFCAISEDQENCADCTSIAAGVEYSRFLCDTTNFDDLTDLGYLTNVVIEACNYGKIFYPGPVNFTGVNLDDYVNITQNNISINIVELPQLNRTATLTFYNLDFVYPIATKNNNPCEGNGCTFISYEDGTLTYSVSGFNVNDVTAYSSVDIAPVFDDYNKTLSTNFTRYMEISDITEVNNAEFWKSGIGYIKFIEETNFTNISIDDMILFNYNYLELELSSEPNLNKRFEAGLYNLNMTYPIIEIDGKRCEGDSCSFSSYYPNDYLKFTVNTPSEEGVNAVEAAANVSKFNGATTNFTRGLGDFTGDIEDATGIVFEIWPYGKIEFTEPVNVSKLNATFYVNITERKVLLNLSGEPRLNKSSNITFYNLSHVYPEVYLNGSKCSTCSFKAFDSGNNFIIGISDYVNLAPVITMEDAAPNVSSFNGNTTNFSRRVLSSIENVENVVLEILPYRKIEFSGNVNVTNTNLSWSNSNNINFGTTSIFINSTKMPGLNQSATITLKNLSFYKPLIMLDGGTECPSSVCSVISYPYSTGNENICSNNCTMVFTVSDFRYNQYTVVENTTVPQFVNGPIGEIEWRESRNYTFEDIGNYFFDADNSTLLYSVINLSCKNMSFNISHPASPQIDFKLIPDLNWFGQCGIRLNVSDGNSTIWSNIIVLTVKADLAPVFSGPIPAQSWNEDNNIIITLSDYFSDPELDDINFTYQFVGAVKDNNITVAINNVTDQATLVPSENWNGTRYIIFTAHDYKLDTSSNYVALNVNPVNDAPVCNYTYNILDDEDTNISLDMTRHCSDVDDTISDLNMTLNRDAQNFNVTYYTNRTIIFVPHTHWNGYESFIVNVTDAGGLSTQTNEFVISLDQVADPVVVASPTLNVTIQRDTNYTFEASDYVYDPDDGAVYYYTHPSNANITVELNIITGAAKIIPNRMWYGSEWVNITAEDESSSGTVAINVTIVKNVSYAPYLKAIIPNLTWDEDATYYIDLDSYFDDFSMDFSSSGHPNITITINDTDGNVTMVPDANFFGESFVVFSASNSQGSATSNNVTLTISNINDTPEQIVTIPTQYWVVGTNKTINLSQYFTDVDGDDLNYTSEQPLNPAVNITPHIDNTTHIVILEPNSSFTGTGYINFTAFDPYGFNITSNNITLKVVMGNSTIINSTLEGVHYNGSYEVILGDVDVIISNITDSTISNGSIESSNITNSTVTGSSLVNCVVINSYVVNYVGSDCVIENSNIDPSVSGGLGITGTSGVTYSLTGSKVNESSEVTMSNVVYTNVSNATVDDSNLTYCIIEDAWVRGTNGTGCTISGTTFSAGTITFPNGTIANPTQSLWFVLNYPPEVSFAYTSSSLEFNFTSTVSDLNVDASAINDSLTYSWDFGDSTTNNTIDANHTYSSYGSYTVILTVTDFYGESANYSQTVSITAPGGGTSSSSGGGGGGGSSCSDECIEGAKGCTTENGVVTCGNYDTDSCLEWGNEIICSENTECFGGFCQPKACVPDWICNGWTECEAGTQTRPCDDYNECGTTSGRPATEQDCVMPPPVVEQPIRPPEPVLPPPAPVDEGFELFGVGPWELAIAVLMFTLVLTGSIAVMRTVGRRKSKAMEYTQLASLKTAIQRDIVRGVKETDIRNVLIEQGWADYLVNQALKEINDSMLREPVEKNIMQGFDEANLRDVFVNRGWPKEAVDDTIEDVNLSILQKAIAANLNKGFKMSKIRKGLVGSGWPNQIVDRAIKEHKK